MNIENIFIQWRLSPIRVTTRIHKSANTGTVSPVYRDKVPCAASGKGITQEEMCTSINFGCKVNANIFSAIFFWLIPETSEYFNYTIQAFISRSLMSSCHNLTHWNFSGINALLLFFVALAIEHVSIYMNLWLVHLWSFKSHYFKPKAKSAPFQDYSGEPSYQQSYIKAKNESAVSVQVFPLLCNMYRGETYWIPNHSFKAKKQKNYAEK